MKQLLGKSRILLVVCVIIIVIGVNTVFRKINLRFSRLERETGIAEVQLSRLVNILEQREWLESEYKKNIADLRGIKDSNSFIRRIQEFAQTVDFNIQNIKPMQVKDEGLYKIHSVHIEAEDQIFTLARFLYAFKDLKAVMVDSLKIRRIARGRNPKIRLLMKVIDFK